MKKKRKKEKETCDLTDNLSSSHSPNFLPYFALDFKLNILFKHS